MRMLLSFADGCDGMDQSAGLSWISWRSWHCSLQYYRVVCVFDLDIISNNNEMRNEVKLFDFEINKLNLN